jgi:hypothetical protein
MRWLIVEEPTVEEETLDETKLENSWMSNYMMIEDKLSTYYDN